MWAQQPFVPTIIGTAGTPSRVLFGVYHGALVRSADLGLTWKPVYITEPGLPQPPVQGFDIDALNPNTVYLATTIAAGAFWKSTDGGTTWAKSNTGLPTTGPGVDFFKQVLDVTTFLYIKAGNLFYKSSDQGTTWVGQGMLPGSAGQMDIAPSRRAWMYYVEPSTLAVFFSGDEGHSWQAVGNIPAAVSNATITGIGVPAFNPSIVYVSVNGAGQGGTFVSTSAGATFTDASAAGLGTFAKLLSFPTGPAYALTPGYMGTFRSTDSAQSWQSIGFIGDVYGVTAVDQNITTTVYGLKTAFGTTMPTAAVTSTDSGSTWSVIPATITPTIAKPAPIFNITVEQGAPYSLPFTVQPAEDATWKLPVTVTTSGESWIKLGATSGTTPLPDSIIINTAGLLPGPYSSTITISAPQSNNKSVSIPLKLTVVATGGLGLEYLISTIAGNGNATVSSTTGMATSIAIGAPKALAFDASGNLLISAGSRLWQLSSGTLVVLAGNGVNASNGDGSDPLSASIADPDAIALDSQGSIYFTEYAPAKIRKLAGGNISTYLDMARAPFNQTVGSHSLLFDSANNALLTTPSGLLIFDGTRLLTATSFAFSDPYATVADMAGNVYVSDRGLHQIFKITPTHVVSVIAGTGLPGFSGDGGPASQAALNTPEGMAFDALGTLYIADSGNHRIRTITTDGNIHTIAGSGIAGFAGDTMTADFASFLNPSAVAVDPSGVVYVADTGNNRVRKLVLQSSVSRTPTPQPAAIVNGPSSAAKLSPGGVFVIYGSLLAPPGIVATATSPAWPKTLATVSVTINGVPAPLYYVSPTQINGQVPFETPLGTATVMITSNGSLPATITFPVVAAEPAIIWQTGTMQALAVNLDGSINSRTTPAHAGDIEVVYLTGIGQTNPPASTGVPAATSPPLATVNYPYQITVNGIPTVKTPFSFLGLAPGWTGLAQANFQIPTNLIAGDYQVIVTVNGESSPPATISIK